MSIHNKTKFAKKIGVSRRRLYVYIKEGMPIDSDEAACEWIEIHYGSGGGKNLKPDTSEKGFIFDHETPPGISVNPGDVERTDTVGVLARQLENEGIAWSLLQDAQKASSSVYIPLSIMEALKESLQSGDKDRISKAAGVVADSVRREAPLAKVSAATRHYNLCSDSRLKTEESLVRIQNEEKTLAGKAEQLAMDVVLEVLRPMRQALRTLPARLAPRCNPAGVEIARVVLDEEVNRLFEATFLGKESDQ